MAKINRKDLLSVLNIGARLLIICLVVAGIVSLVNEVTKTRYAELQEEQKQESMASIFGLEKVTYEELGNEVYRISQNGETVGYCVQTVTAGFGGDMTLMVGFRDDADYPIAGVQILSHSETPGLGAKANDASYLSQYNGKSGELALHDDIDAISGATISSRAVLSGVNSARETLLNSLTLTGGDGQ